MTWQQIIDAKMLDSKEEILLWRSCETPRFVFMVLSDAALKILQKSACQGATDDAGQLGKGGKMFR